MSAPARVRIAVTGAAGRMGRMVIDAAAGEHDVEIASALVRPGHPWSGRDLGVCVGRLPTGRTVMDDTTLAFAGANVVIDFTHPTALLAFLPTLRRARVALVSGTTGLSEQDQQVLHEAAKEIPIVFAANMSLGVNVLLGLVRQASALLGPGYDLELLELHHRHKKDSPSGTALALAGAGLEARGGELRSAVNIRGWGQTGPRRGIDEVGIGALRGGDVVGEHTVFFLGSGERIELTHRATDRRAFAQGAVRAAQWVVGRPPGLYSMQDVLGLGAPVGQ